MMEREYANCFFCGGEVRERRLTREVWREGSRCIIENVPMGVCQQCGERFLQPEIARCIDARLSREAGWRRSTS